MSQCLPLSPRPALLQVKEQQSVYELAETIKKKRAVFIMYAAI